MAFSKQDSEEDNLHSCHSSRQRLLNLIQSDDVKINDEVENPYIECDDFEQSFKEEKI